MAAGILLARGVESMARKDVRATHPFTKGGYPRMHVCSYIGDSACKTSHAVITARDIVSSQSSTNPGKGMS